MHLSKYLSAAIAAALVFVSIEVLVEALLGGFERPAILLVLAVLAACVLAASVLGTRGNSTATPYW